MFISRAAISSTEFGVCQIMTEEVNVTEKQELKGLTELTRRYIK